MESRQANRKTVVSARWLLALALGGLLPLSSAWAEGDAGKEEEAVPAADEASFVPLPGELFEGRADAPNPVIDLTNRAADFATQAFNVQTPDALTVDNEGGSVLYDAEKSTLTYEGGSSGVHLVTDEGLDVTAPRLTADLANKKARLDGPLTIYQDESVTLAESGTYDWTDGTLRVDGVRSKVNGILVRGSAVDYGTDEHGKRYMCIHDAYISTEDIEEPTSWVGAGKLTVHPGDYGSLTRLSLAGKEKDVAVPIIGWITISHSLNPEEGYLPNFGSKGIWGTYLLNSYGFLLGNRRVEHGIPVSDYVLTTHADYRTRRGLAFGLDLKDVEMRRLYPDMTGLATYLAVDEDPSINPTNTTRSATRHNRYRVALQARWSLDDHIDLPGDWALTTNINIVSDRYALRDFFEDECKVDDKPDNTIALTRRTDRGQDMIFTRFAPNNYYMTDERLEASSYRSRRTISGTPIAYETRTSFGIMRQNLSALQKIEYREALDNLSDESLRDYYERLLNAESYVRFNTTHEFSTSFHVLRFLNVTPKAGAGYTGYYDVGGVGSDNRLLGYLGCDFDIKFNRHWEKFRVPWLDLKGLTHVIHPYASISHGTISSSNDLVPKVDTWSSTLGSSTTNPMPLDLMGFTGIDGWGNWTVWRMGVRNDFTSTCDGERVSLLTWNVFMDYNVDNPNTERRFSNLYSILRFRPSQRFSARLETQTPTVEDGDGFRQYNTSFSWQPTPWFEGSVGHRYISNHPVQSDASQFTFRANLRINEHYTFAGRWYWDVEKKRFPIQQYSLFRNSGAWYVGATLFLRNNGGRKETGFGISFTLGETGTALPVNFF